MLPQTAPARLPRPPSIAPVSSPMESARVKAPGETIAETAASRAPPSPAHAELTTKASICILATFRPDRDAATSLSRSARQLRPILLRPRLASRTRVISAPAQVIQASQRVGGKVTPRKPGVVTLKPRPRAPPPSPAYLLARDGSATASISVAPAR